VSRMKESGYAPGPPSGSGRVVIDPPLSSSTGEASDPRPGGADVTAPPHGRNLDHAAGLRGLDHLAIAHVDGDVVDGGRIGRVVGVEHEVAGLQVGLRHLGAVVVLVAGI